MAGAQVSYCVHGAHICARTNLTLHQLPSARGDGGYRLACRSNEDFRGLAGPVNSALDIKASKLLRALNYPTPAELFSALKHWAEAHMWCLRNIAEAMLYLNDISRDVIEEQVHGPQGWRLLFVLSPGVTDVNKRTPLNAFRLTHHGYGRDDGNEQNRIYLAKSMAMAKDKGLAPPCVVPVAYYLDGMNLVTHGLFSLEHVPRRADPPLPDHVRVALADLRDFSLVNVDAGQLAWRVVKIFNSPKPVIGELVRVKKKWEWMPLACDWDTIEGIIAQRVAYSFRPGRSLQERLTVLCTL